MSDAGAPSPSPETTGTLLERARQGDDGARNRLIQRYLPAFQRWAHGRLPARARDRLDTDDLVQLSLVKALDHLEQFEPRFPGAFLAYLRRVLVNEVRQELRRSQRRPVATSVDDNLVDDEPSPLEEIVGLETLQRYEAALERLPEDQRAAVLLRVELNFTYAEIADSIGSPSPNAARMVVKRALLRLAEEMEDDASKR